MKIKLATVLLWLAATGLVMCGASRIKAANYTYSTTVDLATGSYTFTTNNGIINESFVVILPSALAIDLYPGDSLSGVISFANNQSLVVTNTTGTNADSAGILFYQSSPTTNVTCNFGFQLLGVSGHLNSANPAGGQSQSVFPYSPFQIAAMNQLTTSSVSFQGFAYSFTNEYAMPVPVILFPADLLFQGGAGDIVAPIPLNLQLKGQSVVLSWNDPGSVFSLQASTNLAGPFIGVPGAASPYTNSIITGAEKFFRLKAY